ncbi:hypothetical protein EG328_000300 [Venturia inaequalis]|uniref:Uncharacterized protein n=1 Tax=Venturia inaequalis TaxID=5025 RepID=A0A8H3V3P9_VENIN|nr:hypothetical protein EG328_000300 [Venturia inaequalis]
MPFSLGRQWTPAKTCNCCRKFFPTKKAFKEHKGKTRYVRGEGVRDCVYESGSSMTAEEIAKSNRMIKESTERGEEEARQRYEVEKKEREDRKKRKLRAAGEKW